MTVNDQTMSSEEHMTNKEHMPTKDQKSPKFTTYKREEEVIADTNFRNDVEEYHAPYFYNYLGWMQVKYAFIK